MKVLFVETGLEGHHQIYLRGLVENCNVEAVVYTPQIIKSIKCKQYAHYIDWSEKKFLKYYKWISDLYQVSKRETPDIIHFVDGDSIMRYMGIGFDKLKCKKVIITYHHFFSGYLRKVSYKLMARNRNIVVHTERFKTKLQEVGINSVTHIEYPAFDYYEIKNIDSKNARDYFGLKDEFPIIGVIGATDEYKGLDILIDALKLVRIKLCLFIAGKESDIKADKINEIKQCDNIILKCSLGWLTEEEYLMAINACDYIVLPYRYSFDGASGPLVDGVIADKIIIGANHGSLGNLINNNNLGYVFETENIRSLASMIECALSSSFHSDNIERKHYLNYLRPERFFLEYNSLYASSLKDNCKE